MNCDCINVTLLLDCNYYEGVIWSAIHAIAFVCVCVLSDSFSTSLVVTWISHSHLHLRQLQCKQLWLSLIWQSWQTYLNGRQKLCFGMRLSCYSHCRLRCFLNNSRSVKKVCVCCTAQGSSCRREYHIQYISVRSQLFGAVILNGYHSWKLAAK